jgi:hypothetical protein
MRDILQGLFIEMPISIMANTPWNLVLILLGAFFLFKTLGVFEAVSQIL